MTTEVLVEQATLPNGWQRVTLGEIAEIRRGASPRPINDPHYFGDGPGWVRIVDVTRSTMYLRETEQQLSSLGASKSVRVSHGDVIMSICATIGVPVIVDMEACIHDGFVLFDKLSPNVDTRYLIYLLQTLEAYFDGYAQPGTQKNLNTEIVQNAPVPLPPLDEQKRIAAILGDASNTIQQTKQIIATLRRLKEALAEQLLTRGIGHTTFVESELGEIPQCWQVVTLGDVFTLSYGFGLPESKREEGEYPVYGSNGITGYHKSYTTHPPALVVGRKGAAGFIQRVSNKFWPIDTTYYINRDSTAANLDFLFYYLINLKLTRLMSASAIPGLNRDDVYQMKAALPPLAEQKQIAAILDDVEARIAVEERRKIVQEKLKRGLMHDLLSGRVRTNAFPLYALSQ